ncbi:MAG: hypothetical protein HUU23_06640 [Caldilineales bacterium]|nr:hypothetical protein [Caldilineales bacterium]
MKKKLSRMLLTALAALLFAAAAWAQSGQGYNLTWWTVDGGGEVVSGKGYTLLGTAGQAEAGPALSGSGYTLSSGFWVGDAAAPAFHTYLPGVRRGSP